MSLMITKAAPPTVAMRWVPHVWSEDGKGFLIYNSFELTNGFLWTKVGRSDNYWFLSMR